MLAKRMISLIMALTLAMLFTNCQEDELLMKRGKKTDVTLSSDSDDDSDRPPWAGGNNSENPHSKGNTDTGVPKGMDYGDLYMLPRDENGVPELTEDNFVQPVDVYGDPLPLNDEGELINPELATEVEFGRLNIVRAPQSVLDAGLMEALKPLTEVGAVISVDFCGRLTSTYTDPVTSETIVKTIDSPRENLAIYQYIMQNLFEGNGNLLRFLHPEFDPLEIAASCYAAGSDKTDIIDIDELVYINGFLDAFGLNPIINTGEVDARGNDKKYFDFGDYGFFYDREATFGDRFIQFAVWDGTFYGSNGPIFSIFEYMTGGMDVTDTYSSPSFQFTYSDTYPNDFVAGFAKAADDALQVLDLVHGDSNITPVPDPNSGL